MSAPDVLIFCRMHFSGFPYICILTKEGNNPNYEGKSDRSLLDKSNVFNFFKAIILLDNFCILLSLMIKTVKLGQF